MTFCRFYDFPLTRHSSPVTSSKISWSPVGFSKVSTSRIEADDREIVVKPKRANNSYASCTQDLDIHILPQIPDSWSHEWNCQINFLYCAICITTFGPHGTSECNVLWQFFKCFITSLEDALSCRESASSKCSETTCSPWTLGPRWQCERSLSGKFVYWCRGKDFFSPSHWRKQCSKNCVRRFLFFR